MKGFTFKIATLGVAFLSAALLSSQLSATNHVNDLSKTTMLNAKLGCLSCHQSESMRSNKTLKQNHETPRRQNQTQTVPAN